MSFNTATMNVTLYHVAGLLGYSCVSLVEALWSILRTDYKDEGNENQLPRQRPRIVVYFTLSGYRLACLLELKPLVSVLAKPLPASHALQEERKPQHEKAKIIA